MQHAAGSDSSYAATPRADGSLPPRLKPMRADARRNREKLLEVARQVFSSEGTGIPLDYIAEKAGLGAGTVYRHFPTKELLIQAVLVSRIDLITTRAQVLAAAGPPSAALDRFIIEMLYEGGEKRDLIDALMAFGVDVGASMAEVNARLTQSMGELLVQAQRSGSVRDDIDVDDLMALVLGVLIAIHRGGYRPDLPERTLSVLLDGLRTTTSRPLLS